MAGSQDRVGRLGHVEQGDPPARPHHPPELVEEGAQVGKVAEGEAAHRALGGPIREGQSQRVALYQRRGGTGVVQHAERQIHAERPKPG